MNKEEILKKMKKERDERESFYDLKGYSFSYIFSLVATLILLIDSYAYDKNVLGYVSIIFLGISGDQLGYFLRNRKIWNLISFLVLFILSILVLVKAVLTEID